MNIKLLTWLSTYIIIILCELGDKTQLAVLLFTSNNPHKKWTIFLASSLALILCVLVEVTIGLTLANYIGPDLINKFAGGVFVLLGIIMLGQNFNLPEVVRELVNRKIMVKSKPETESVEAEI
ncbi:MAG: TMEM165/GDT1 family protein [Syntrophomonas sp.]|nr:TMEM165/GDT1 family protein [Syntrophomonas sp.]